MHLRHGKVIFDTTLATTYSTNLADTFIDEVLRGDLEKNSRKNTHTSLANTSTDVAPQGAI